MLLRNWYNTYKSAITQTVITNGLVNTSGEQYDSGYYESTYNYDKPYKFYAKNVAIGSNVDGSFMVGSGTTPPTLDDYNLESRITADLTGQVIRTHDGTGIIYINLTNSSSNPITISEIGYYAMCYTKEDSYSSPVGCLLERSVFDPVTIQSGEIAQIQYKININIPE